MLCRFPSLRQAPLTPPDTNDNHLAERNTKNMRSLLMASTILLGFVAGPVVAQTSQPSSAISAVATGSSALIVGQSTTLPPVTVTAPAPRENDPWHISTWRFHAGPSVYAPPNGAWGLSGGSPSGGVAIAPRASPCTRRGDLRGPTVPR